MSVVDFKHSFEGLSIRISINSLSLMDASSNVISADLNYIREEAQLQSKNLHEVSFEVRRNDHREMMIYPKNGFITNNNAPHFSLVSYINNSSKLSLGDLREIRVQFWPESFSVLVLAASYPIAFIRKPEFDQLLSGSIPKFYENELERKLRTQRAEIITDAYYEVVQGVELHADAVEYFNSVCSLSVRRLNNKYFESGEVIPFQRR